MALHDAHQPWERELINEYGLKKAIEAIRAYVTYERSKAFLEAQREALQVARWRNITL